MAKTVKQLIEELQQYPEDFIVMIARDEEGNGFKEFSDIGYGIADLDSDDYEGAFSTYVYDKDEFGWRDEDTEREATLEESNAICLWP